MLQLVEIQFAAFERKYLCRPAAHFATPSSTLLCPKLLPRSGNNCGKGGTLWLWPRNFRQTVAQCNAPMQNMSMPIRGLILIWLSKYWRRQSDRRKRNRHFPCGNSVEMSERQAQCSWLNKIIMTFGVRKTNAHLTFMRPQRWVARNQEGKPMQAAMQIQARIKPDPRPEADDCPAPRAQRCFLCLHVM